MAAIEARYLASCYPPEYEFLNRTIRSDTVHKSNSLDPIWDDLQSMPQRESRAKAAHLRLIIDHSIFVFLGNAVASIALLIGAWGSVPTLHLAGWTVLTVAFNALRYILGRRFSPDGMSDRQIAQWENGFLLSTLISGLLWGSVGWAFFIPGNLAHNFLLSIFVISMAAAATSSHAYHRLAYPMFFVPAVLPLTLNLWLEPATSAKAIGSIIPIYFLFLYILSRQIYRSAHSAIVSGMTHQHHAMHDYLTGAKNRRAFEAWLEKEWARALRTQKPLALIIADIDDFKRHNDSYGHASGDKILQAIAKMIQSRIRNGTDLMARVGGEEFAVILPETTLANAQSVAEDLRNRAHELQPEIDNAGVIPTLSLGVSAITPNNNVMPSALFDYADQALYEAKRQGKDRVSTKYVENINT